jgi:hypothetical protein
LDKSMVTKAGGNAMIEILQFLIKFLAFLIVDGRYRFVNSMVSSSFGGDAFIVLESDKMRWRIVRDRTQMFAEFQSIKDDEKNWYTTDLLQRLLTESHVKTAELSPEVAFFLGSRIIEIESMFEESCLKKTRRDLADLERIRAKERFG